jgi:hypothetical protein
MSKSDFDRQNEVMMSGVRQLLGKEASSVAPIVAVECEHVSDGYMYGTTATTKILMCMKCLTHYEVQI